MTQSREDMGEMKDDYIKFLSKDERIIVEKMQENGENIYQSDLWKELGMSRAKVSRLLNSLEHNRNLIKKEQYGMTNLIKFKKS